MNRGNYSCLRQTGSGSGSAVSQNRVLPWGVPLAKACAWDAAFQALSPPGPTWAHLGATVLLGLHAVRTKGRPEATFLYGTACPSAPRLHGTSAVGVFLLCDFQVSLCNVGPAVRRAVCSQVPVPRALFVPCYRYPGLPGTGRDASYLLQEDQNAPVLR